MKKAKAKKYKELCAENSDFTFEDFVDGNANKERNIFSGFSLGFAKWSLYLMHVVLICSGLWLFCMISMLIYVISQAPSAES